MSILKPHPTGDEPKRPQPSNKRYTYIVIDAVLCFNHFGPRDPDSYFSRDAQTDLLNAALNESYRWIRTDGNNAIWEKEWTI